MTDGDYAADFLDASARVLREKKKLKKKKNSSRSLITVKTSCGQLYRALLWTQWYLPITASIKSQAMY